MHPKRFSGIVKYELEHVKAIQRVSKERYKIHPVSIDKLYQEMAKGKINTI